MNSKNRKGCYFLLNIFNNVIVIFSKIFKQSTILHMSIKKISLHMFILVLIFQQLVHIYFLKNFSDDGYIYKNDNY